MKAAVFSGPKCIDISETDIRQPFDNEVLIKLEGCGVCGSNFPVWEGREWFKYPFRPGQPGHEGWGIVKSVGSKVSSVKPGDRVAALTYNAYAEFDIAKENSVVKIPEEIKEIPFPGEPLGCAVNIFNRSGITGGSTVAIIGIGFMGALLTQLVHNAGAKTIAVSRRKYSLETAEKCGADYLIEMNDHWKIIEEVKQITSGDFCDTVIEATGLQWPIDIAGELTKIKGKLIIAGYHQDGMRTINMQLWNWRGIDVINAHERDEKIYINGIRDAVDAVKQRKLDPSILYTSLFPLEEINKAFIEMSIRPDGFIKALVMNN